MLSGRVLKKMAEVSALVFLFGTTAVHAQAEKSAPGAGTVTPAPQSGSSAMPATPGKAMTNADQQLMRGMTQANLMEVAAGKVALEKSQNDQVKMYAQRMIDDHSNAQRELQQVAQVKGVTLPAEMDSKHQSMIKKLSSLSGDAFDQRYIAQGGVSEHKKTYDLLKRAETKVSDPDLKQLVTNTLPVVDQHLKMAQQMQAGKAGASSGMSSGGATPETPPGSGTTK
ncbi:MAG: DUF4142 domain-containing protein [Pseudomonadota bacterium]